MSCVPACHFTISPQFSLTWTLYRMRIASEAELAWFFKREAPEDIYYGAGERGDLGKEPNVSSRKPID